MRELGPFGDFCETPWSAWGRDELDVTRPTSAFVYQRQGDCIRGGGG